MKNEFCHIELTTDDVGKAKEFYGGLFSWKFEDVDMGGGMKYTMINPGAGPGGGIMKKPMPEAPTAWMTYVMVEKVDAAMKKAEKLGGKVIVPKTSIPNMGSFSIIQDPTGGCLAVWEAQAPAKGKK